MSKGDMRKEYRRPAGSVVYDRPIDPLIPGTPDEIKAARLKGLQPRERKPEKTFIGAVVLSVALSGILGLFVGALAFSGGAPTYHDAVAAELLRGCEVYHEHINGTEAERATLVSRAGQVVTFVNELYPDATDVTIEVYTVPTNSPVTKLDPTLTVLQVLSYKRCV